ncbi:MAG: spermidine/putrescine ABC transporter substrate-binding protein [Clostridia bacterium]|jgi:spermidine/putrescine transport system substrate-binding protein|nr:spermidine/putrescine ABC transporter substrate-binding protein [Clostridia bacterium]MBR5752065.1 spermidine/putrescine ABC transporter substrate-binding protein [Clostridia bacterium]
MKKLSLVLVLALVLCALPFAARAEGTLTVYNWYDYIDESVLDDFTKETGIKVDYVMFTTVEEMYVKMTTGGGKYDIIVPSDYIIERLIKDDMLAPMDFDKMPNARANLLDSMWTADYDVGNAYSVPYMWGTVGILYNTEYVDEEITSWASLFDPKYKRDVFMLDSIRDTMGVTLKYLGYNLNERSEEALAQVRDLLIKQKNDNIVQGYLVDEVKDKMVGGEAAMAVMWSGDAMYAIEDNDSLVYVVPEEGSNVWIDAMCIPKDSQNYEAALAFIDFMCREDIAARNYDYIHYCSPIRQVVENLDEEEAANPAVNPSQEIIDRCDFFHDIMDYMDVYNKYWMEIRS